MMQPPQAPQGYGGAPPPGQPVQRQKNSNATLAFWLGLASFVTCGLSGIPALIFGLKAKKEIDAEPSRFANAGQATGGIAMGAVGCVIILLGVVGALAPKKEKTTAAPDPTPVATQAAAADDAPARTTTTAARRSARTKPPAEEPAPAAASAEEGNAEASKREEPPSGPPAKFPEVVARFIAMNELKQEAFATTFAGTMLSGSGKVFEVEKCGMLDDSKRWGSHCFKVILDAGAPRVALYYGNKDKATIANYEKGQQVTFKDCKANSIKNWGFWSTATCDMP